MAATWVRLVWLARCVAAASRLAALAPSESLARINATLRGCPIVYFVHCPKTAGTAFVSLLKASPDWLQLKRAGVYVQHGRDFGAPQWRQIAARRAARARTIVAEEIGVGDLAARGYPYFRETCFLATLRAPDAWLASAMRHLRVGLDAVEKRDRYFDAENIQETMVAPPPGGGPYRALVLATLERGAVAVVAGLLGLPPALPVLNRCADRRDRRPCAPVGDAERRAIAAYVETRYADDRRLWARVNATARGLLLLEPRPGPAAAPGERGT